MRRCLRSKGLIYNAIARAYLLARVNPPLAPRDMTLRPATSSKGRDYNPLVHCKGKCWRIDGRFWSAGGQQVVKWDTKSEFTTGSTFALRRLQSMSFYYTLRMGRIEKMFLEPLLSAILSAAELTTRGRGLHRNISGTFTTGVYQDNVPCQRRYKTCVVCPFYDPFTTGV